MKPFVVLACALALAVSVSEAALFQRSSTDVPTGWFRVLSDLPANHHIDFTLAVSRSNADSIMSTFEALAVPSSPRYSQWLTSSQLTAQFGHSAEAHTAVSTWLDSIDAQNVEWVGDYVRARASVSALTPAPGHAFEELEREEDGLRVTRCVGGVVLPDAVAQHVDATLGLIDLHPPPSFQAAGPRIRPVHPPSAADPMTPYPTPIPVEVLSANHHMTFGFFPECNGIQCTKTDLQKLVKGFNIGLRKPSSTSVSKTVFVDEKDALCTTTYGMLVCGVGIEVSNYEVYEIGVANVFLDGGVSGMSWLANASAAGRAWGSPFNLKNRYGVGQTAAPANPAVSSGVVLFGGQYTDLPDLKTFLADMGEPASSSSIVAPNGPNNSSNPGGEGQMDIELITSMARGVDSTFWYSSDSDNGFFIWAQQMLNASSDDTSVPHVWSCSFGIPESTYDKNVGKGVMERVNDDLGLLGMRGFTVVIASGDAGATSIGRGIDSCDAFQPSFPATSPFVVSVSATRFDGPPAPVPSTPGSSSPPFCTQELSKFPVRCDPLPAEVTEVAVACCDTGTIWTTGGGFSSRWSMPSWQQSAVTAYLRNNPSDLPPSSFFNASNRAFPDVSAVGASVPVFIGGELQNSGGTSSSSPFFAGMLALLANELGKPIGPAGPLLYDHASTAFWDVTVGNNACGEQACCPHGFGAAVGYDAVTGLGSLKFDKLLAALKAGGGGAKM